MNLYLTDAKRNFYSEALELIRNCQSEFWDLDSNLDKYIDRINENHNIRTMYSRNGSAYIDDFLGSYLTICYVEWLEQQLINELIPKLISKFSILEYCEFDFSKEDPREQESDGDVNPYLKYIDHKDYWNVNHIRFELRSPMKDHHKLFWSELTNELSRIG